MKLKYFIAIAFILLSSITLMHAQSKKKISENEFSIALGTTYGFTYDRFAPTLQIQYIRLVNPAKFISTGVAYELLKDELYRHSFLIPIEFWVNPSLALIVSPGLTFNEQQPVNYTTHIEARYQFHLGKVRIGPKAKFVFNKYENYLGVGIYAGFPF